MRRDVEFFVYIGGVWKLQGRGEPSQREDVYKHQLRLTGHDSLDFRVGGYRRAQRASSDHAWSRRGVHDRVRVGRGSTRLRSEWVSQSRDYLRL